MEGHQCRGTTSPIYITNVMSKMIPHRPYQWLSSPLLPSLPYPPSPPSPLLLSTSLSLYFYTYNIWNTNLKHWESGAVIPQASTETSKSTFWSFKTLTRRKFLFIGPFTGVYFPNTEEWFCDRIEDHGNKEVNVHTRNELQIGGVLRGCWITQTETVKDWTWL